MIPARFRRYLLPLSLGHAGIDFYENMVAALLPFLVVLLGISYTQAGAAIFAFSLSAFLLQPLVGHYIDRRGSFALMPASLVLSALCFAVIGLVPSFPWILAILVLAGLGNALFHPLATLYVRAASDAPATAMAVWSTSGNLGLALAPLAVNAIFSLGGPSWTVLLLIPGMLVAALLWRGPLKDLPFRSAARSAPSPRPAGTGSPGPDPVRSPEPAEHSPVPPTAAQPATHGKASPADDTGRGPLARLTGAAICRACTHVLVNSYLALFIVERGGSPALGNRLFAITLLISAFATVIGGALADRVGRKPVVTGSLAASLVGLTLGFSLGGWSPLVLLPLASFALLLPHSVFIVLAQELVPRNPALASGMILGFPYGVASVAVLAAGWPADRFGLGPTLSVAVAVLLGISLLFFSRVPETAAGAPRRVAPRPSHS